MAGPLKGIRVLDLSRVLAGPWATQILADLGAEVVKIERPGVGDDTRHWGPPFVKDAEGHDTADAVYTLACNRGKKSLALDIAAPEGQEIIRDLARRADILVENFRVDALARYGLDYDSLAALNPALIYCSITGFGQTGPYRERAGYDYLIQGMGGLMSVTGSEETGPLRVGVAIADLTTGMNAAIAILAALHHRDRTAGQAGAEGGSEKGEGQFIDMALLDTQVSWLANQNMNWLAGGMLPGPSGSEHPNLTPYGPYRVKDGRIIIAVGNQRQYEKLTGVLDRPDLASDPRFATNAARLEHRAELRAEMEAVLATRPAAHWLAALDEAGIASGPINTIEQVFEDAQVKARGLRFDVPHAAAGTVPGVRSPFLFSATPPEYAMGPPLLGQHSDEVLEGLGLSADDIAALRDKGVVG